MEILILDKLLRPIDVVDVFESMIFTERFSEVGDFQLVVPSISGNRRRFVTGMWIMITDSNRVMEVLTIEDKTDAEGRAVLTIKGTEILNVLSRRLALFMDGEAIAPVWWIEDAPAEVMRIIFNEICLFGSVSPLDVIPFLYAGNTYPEDNIPEPTTIIKWEQKPATVLEAQKELSDIYDLGFRLYKDPNMSRLHYNVYAGSDRTTNQTVYPPVIFSPDMENLANTTEFTDTSSAFNVIHVILTYKNELEVEITVTLYVNENELSPPEGFDRRVKQLVLSSVPEEITDIEAWMIQSGKDELMKSRPINAFDGQINQTTQYVYERDYYLGDLVEMRAENGATAFMRVEEFIHVEDLQGARSYPTLTTKGFAAAGTWDSWQYDVEWNAMGEDQFWANQ